MLLQIFASYLLLAAIGPALWSLCLHRRQRRYRVTVTLEETRTFHNIVHTEAEWARETTKLLWEPSPDMNFQEVLRHVPCGGTHLGSAKVKSAIIESR